jgi:hypothetical protein
MDSFRNYSVDPVLGPTSASRRVYWSLVLLSFVPLVSKVPEGLWVMTPVNLPLYGWRARRWLNRVLPVGQLRLVMLLLRARPKTCRAHLQHKSGTGVAQRGERLQARLHFLPGSSHAIRSRALDHLLHQIGASHGGRIIGELCHFLDWARTVVGCPMHTVTAAALPDAGRFNRDNLSSSISFRDGSLANLLYPANGDRAVAKEYFEVFCEGSIARVDDFKTLSLSSDGKTETFKGGRDKGHRREMELTIKAVEQGKDARSPLRSSSRLQRRLSPLKKPSGRKERCAWMLGWRIPPSPTEANAYGIV